MEQIINAIGTIRSYLSEQKSSREMSLAITKLDEAMFWLGVEQQKELNEGFNEAISDHVSRDAGNDASNPSSRLDGSNPMNGEK